MSFMTAVIDGKRYDPVKATLIGDAVQMVYHTDGGNFTGRASLYETSSGNYFIQADGRQGSWFGNDAGYTGMSPEDREYCRRIYALSPEQALAWSEKYLHADDFASSFAAAISDA